MEDNNTSTPMKTDESVTLTIRLIMQGKEVGSIIGKKGEIVNRFREESGAKINISDGSCPERIVTVSGTTSAIFSAFTLITKKFEEWCSQFSDVGKVGKTQIPIRLIVPASQCGSLIGKSGSKIKEIRQSTGCSIQVASEMLPNSTERAVTLSGTAEQITQCIYQICLVMLESPPRGATIPYRPKPQVSGPVILANGQAYTIQGNYAVPAQEVAKNPLASLAALGLAGITPTNTGGLNPTALAALAGSQLRTANTSRTQQQQHEMTVSNDLIGCIIGKGGTKIAEIRQISGAMIRISNCEEREGGNTDRTITISGNPDSVALAQYLINMSVELQKANLQEANNGGANGQANNASNSNNNNTNVSNGASNGNANTNNSSSNNNSGGGNHISGTTTLGGNNSAGSGGGGGSNGSLNQSGGSNHSSNNSLNNLNTNTSNANNSNTNNNTQHSTTAMTLTNNTNSSNSNGNNTSGNNLTLSTTSNNPTNPFSTSLPFSNTPNPFANSTTVSSLATAIPLAQLLAKPGALNALSSLTALGGLTDLLGGLATLNGPPIQTTGVHRTKSFASTRFRSHNHADGGADSEKTRNKFNPY
ncbi:poly(rC)-binding protein 3 isoform X5 [Bactrocera dorsalis]|uniref:Poly(RC)-binding protein 3 isoform X5 n=1 Tax=Bactrocera dorsalis TaxID=27457 RepID=A0A8N4L2K6_BACDO|nr:poly(rC)-binding protein 3 isoform X5 [Bactrocera dorsalis]XP_029406535.2 poly(rC)-binding protein 3 isoform X5 [Bactrocera dorsalis]XP_029406536.2 poly(rC)-binding protein 3 isoform X5 [Bactrocera dorsalis]XP_029406537.2 poly(rC)-binding protein 3 isoform X5 [Bactrocera dorsalis]XP_049315128.1 poly(rC)-binding protein 3 isoform X5 [Bactrocera dorsalis]